MQISHSHDSRRPLPRLMKVMLCSGRAQDQSTTSPIVLLRPAPPGEGEGWANPARLGKYPQSTLNRTYENALFRVALKAVGFDLCLTPSDLGCHFKVCVACQKNVVSASHARGRRFEPYFAQVCFKFNWSLFKRQRSCGVSRMSACFQASSNLACTRRASAT